MLTSACCLHVALEDELYWTQTLFLLGFLSWPLSLVVWSAPACPASLFLRLPNKLPQTKWLKAP